MGNNYITFEEKGDFKKLNSFFERALEIFDIGRLNKYAEECIRLLEKSTPKDTGETSRSWSYDISRTNDVVSINFYNSNVNNGVNVAILLQYGHSTKNGGWIEGIDYINPAIREEFNKIVDKACEEIKR